MTGEAPDELIPVFLTAEEAAALMGVVLERERTEAPETLDDLDAALDQRKAVRDRGTKH